MPQIIVTSPLARDGKSVVAAGLAAALRRDGASVRLERVEGEPSADADAAQLARVQGVRGSGAPIAANALPTDSDHTVLEADVDVAAQLKAAADAVVVVVRHGEADDATLERTLQDLQPLGVIVNAAPLEAVEAAGSRVVALGGAFLAALPSDRLLAAPLVRDMAAAIQGELSGDEDLFGEASQDLVVGPVSAHEGMDYFKNYPDKTVVLRHDRVDIALGALDYGPLCMIISGGRPTLPYIAQRAESEAFALITTALTTAEAVNAIGPLYGSAPFAGRRKIERAAALIAAHVPRDALRAGAPA